MEEKEEKEEEEEEEEEKERMGNKKYHISQIHSIIVK